MRGLKTAALIFAESIRNFVAHYGLSMSAAISFFAMFSFFPLLLLALSVFATYLGSSELGMSRLSDLLSDLTPVGAGIIMGWVRSAARNRSIAWGIGALAFFWGARLVFITLAWSASIIWGRQGWKDIVLRQVVALVLVACAALLLLASLLLPGVVEEMYAVAGATVGRYIRMGLILVPYFFSFLTFYVIYLFTSPGRVPKRNVLLIAAIVSLTWEIAKNAFLTYIGMTQITSVYGSIGGIIVLMLWIHVSTIIVLWGMELLAAWHAKPRQISHIKKTRGLLVIE
ncbi:MAG: YihY/virulence factor BrkB family protein [bacterium]|jgi:membrane protein